MRRFEQFLQLVQTAAIVSDVLVNQSQPGVGCQSVWVLWDAMHIDPRCLPDDLETATWQFVDARRGGSEFPAWLRYRQPFVLRVKLLWRGMWRRKDSHGIQLARG